jgi:hypothetical protein
VQEQRYRTHCSVPAGRVLPTLCVQSITYGGILMSTAVINTLDEGPADAPVL